MNNTSIVNSTFSNLIEETLADIKIVSKESMRSLLNSGWTSQDIATSRNIPLEKVKSYIRTLGLTPFEKGIGLDKESYATRRKMSLLQEMTGHAEGACQHCGIKPGLENLCFHHVEFRKDGPYKDDPGIPLHRRSYKQMEEEKEVCCVLCMHCHNTFHKWVDRPSYRIPKSLKYAGSHTYHTHLGVDKKPKYKPVVTRREPIFKSFRRRTPSMTKTRLALVKVS